MHTSCHHAGIAGANACTLIGVLHRSFAPIVEAEAEEESEVSGSDSTTFGEFATFSVRLAKVPFLRSKPRVHVGFIHACILQAHPGGMWTGSSATILTVVAGGSYGRAGQRCAILGLGPV